MSAQHPADRTGRDPDPELSQFALDSDTSPASVLPAKANDEFDELIGHRRPARTSLCSPSLPFARCELSVPPQKGVRGNEEAPPTCPREQSAQRGKDRSIRGPVPHPGMELTFENTHLVAEHDDLDILVEPTSPPRRHKAEDTTQPEVDEREDHGG